jgi:hypothetical protein
MRRAALSRQREPPAIHQRNGLAPNIDMPTPRFPQRSATSAEAAYAAQAAALKLGLPAPPSAVRNAQPVVHTARRIPVTLRTVDGMPEKFMGSGGTKNDHDRYRIEYQQVQEGQRLQLYETPVGRMVKVKRLVIDVWSEIKALWGKGPPDFYPFPLSPHYKDQTTHAPEMERLYPKHGITLHTWVGDIPTFKRPGPAIAQKKRVVLSPPNRCPVNYSSFTPPESPNYMGPSSRRGDSLTTPVTQWSDVHSRNGHSRQRAAQAQNF